MQQWQIAMADLPGLVLIVNLGKGLLVPTLMAADCIAMSSTQGRGLPMFRTIYVTIACITLWYQRPRSLCISVLRLVLMIIDPAVETNNCVGLSAVAD